MNNNITISKTLIDEQELNGLADQAQQIKLTNGYAHRLESHFSGTLSTKNIGSGMDYAESRPYQVGDDPRFINWRLTARSNETLVKTFHTESSPTLCVLMDRGISMRFGTRKRLKVTQAARVATLLSLASRQHRLALSGMIIEESSSSQAWFPSSKNNQAFDAWIDGIATSCSPSFTNLQSNPSKDWQLILQNLTDKNPQGSLVYLVSDFDGLDSECQSTLEALQSQHHVIAIHITDSAEHNLSNSGTLRFKAPVKTGIYQVKSSSEKQRELFYRRASTHHKRIKALFKERGIQYRSVLTTDDNLAPIIPLPLEGV